MPTSIHLLDPLNKDRDKLNDLFEKLYSGNTILFLGAGASITDKKYLSKEIIEYYKNILGIDSDINDIVKFVDTLSSNPNFERRDFDLFVKGILEKLHYNDIHKTILSINWRLIITTNYDLLLEKAYDDIKNTSEKAFELLPVRNSREYEGHANRNVVKYAKLNGCMSDMGKYKFVFSSDDFRKANGFYKKVLNELKSLSPQINFLSVGYSYSDPLAEILLGKFDSYNYRNRKIMYNIDPSIQEDDYRLGFLEENKICTIKLTALDFFNSYKEWELEKYASKPASRNLKISNKKNEPIKLNPKLSSNLKGIITQIGNAYEGENIEEKEFYLGEEPNFNNIRKGHDILRKAKVEETINEIWKSINNINVMIPFIYLTGSFGTGKTTFIYRVINDLINNSDKDVIAFEISDIENFRKELAIDLIKSLPTKHIIFYCSDLEVDSYYKSILNLRNEISFEQIPDKNICFLSSIRENILKKHRSSINGTNTPEINIDSPLEENEVNQLLERLKENELISYRDFNEKELLKVKVLNEFDGDTFISLLDLITNGKHSQDLRSAYSQLSHKGKEAFIYTALLHRFGLSMPSGLLKNIIADDWSEFTEKVLKVEGKGILIHENVDSIGTEPDIYFRTKHKIIAEQLTNLIIKDNSKLFNYYLTITRKLNTGYKSCRLTIDLMKSLRDSGDFDDFQINKLYDSAYTVLQDDAFFLLNYSNNLQHRDNVRDLERGIELLQYAETKLPIRKSRDSRFIHKRGVLNFYLSKNYYKSEKELDRTLTYLDEAEDLFLLKLQLDPSSSYSYTDYITLLLWKLKHINLSDVEEIRTKVKIEELLNTGLTTVSENRGRIVDLQLSYSNDQQGNGDSLTYLKDLEELYYNKTNLRPYVCVLLYNFYMQNENFTKAEAYFNEIENYKDEDDIASFLFKIYGKNLHNANIRTKFYQLSKRFLNSNKINKLRYNYLNYVANYYDGYFSEGNKYLQVIRSDFHYQNPEFKQVWFDSDGQAKIYTGYIIKNKNYFNFKIRGQSGSYRITKTSYKDSFIEGEEFLAELHFYLSGVFAHVYKE
ncbi:SIR2 family protein [Siphonobacter sp. SORGH_AS_1065]|uniref:SIR2 family protein n=1 Tax=Siphonobacter sp. SORGH_AS_1065 TaxID=3041795 RepID=UPI00278012B9|nr:SIR2 family protein [Siphonobacter sp. SORGH_AS_1065]MDQ1085681.1 hypothetical protein [Siphonobacter sp. SORGH_AS_1065]